MLLGLVHLSYDSEVEPIDALRPKSSLAYFWKKVWLPVWVELPMKARLIFSSITTWLLFFVSATAWIG